MAGDYFASRSARANDKRMDFAHGWFFYGRKLDAGESFLKPGYTSVVCVAISKLSGRMYRVSPPRGPWLPCPHEEHILQFHTHGRIGNPDNRTWKWIRLSFHGKRSDIDEARIARLLASMTTLDSEAADQVVQKLTETGGPTDMLKCLSEEHEEECVSRLRQLIPGANIRHSLRGILLDHSNLPGTGGH